MAEATRRGKLATVEAVVCESKSLYAVSRGGTIEPSHFYAVDGRLWFENPRAYTALVEDVSPSPKVE